MKITGKISVFLALLFSATMAYSQDCKTLLNQAKELYKKNCTESIKHYKAYKECNPNATDITDEKIKILECECNLQEGDILFLQKNCKDARKRFQEYKKCNPKALGIDEKIYKCNEFTIKSISKDRKIVDVDINCGGKVSKKQRFCVYEERKEGTSTIKNKIGELKVTAVKGNVVKCKCTKGKDKVYTKFHSSAKTNLVIEKC